MPSIVTNAELRAILGVSSALYSDAYLADIIDASENIVLPMLVTFQSRINKIKLENNVAYFETATIHEFTEGQSVIVTGCGSPFNGTHVVTNDDLGPYVFTAAITNADILEKNVIPAGNAAGSGASTYVANPNVEAAVLTISVEIFQARTAAGGSIEGIDFAVTPFRLSKNLLAKVTGLLGPYLDVETMVG